MKGHSKKTSTPDKSIACTLQGGGALGAYQAGVLHALDDAGYYPYWFVGTSIGAINAAIAASHPEKERIEKLYSFWNSIESPASMEDFPIPETHITRQTQHLISAHTTLMFGQPGFFTPRVPSPHSGWHSTPDYLSYYDTSPLRHTLEQHIDFDRLNDKRLSRISVGAVEVGSGQMIYFDSHNQKIGPEHIMASGALPPGFPAVEIEGKYYWDGGISNNTPLSYVLTHQTQKHLLCFMVHLFDSYGLSPRTMDEVLKRKKDIEFSSRFIKMIELYQQIQKLKNSIHVLSKYIPKELKKQPELKDCIANGHESTIALVRFLYKHDESELSSKDYEFSKKSILERLEQGFKDAKKGLRKSPWNETIPLSQGIELYDMAYKDYLKEHIKK